MTSDDQTILQNQLREAHAESLRLDAANRAINRMSYVHDSKRGWSEAWEVWTAYERSKA